MIRKDRGVNSMSITSQSQELERSLEKIVTHLNAGLYRHSRLDRAYRARAREQATPKQAGGVSALDEEELQADEEDE